MSPAPDPAAVDPRFGDIQTMFFLIGGQKCGTTWLHRYFFEHPEIATPLWKETNYWASVEGLDHSANLRRAYEKTKPTFKKIVSGLLGKRGAVDRNFERSVKLCHRALQSPGVPHSLYADALFMSETPETLAIGESCPQYSLLSSDTFRQMFTLSPNGRFIYIMRDPVQRVISGIKHTLRAEHGRQGVKSEMIEARLSNIAKPNWFHTQMTSYHDNIRRLEAVVPPDRIAYFFFEDLFKQETVGAICDFLGVSHHPANLEKRVNADPRPQIGVSEAAERKVYAAFEPVYKAITARFGDAVPEAWYQTMERLSVEPAQHA